MKSCALPQILYQRVEKSPEQTACVLISRDRQQSYSIRSLVERASDYANYLSKNTSARGIVSICMHHGLDQIAAFIGCMIAGQIPTMTAAPSPRMERDKYTRSFLAIQEHLSPILCFIDDVTTAKLDELSIDRDVLPKVVLSSDVQSANHFNAPNSLPTPADIALVQHSSGTTGLQKGIALSHQSILNQTNAYGRALSIDKSDVIVSWLPLYHDMGLIACLLLPLIYGIPFIQMSPFDWVARPAMLFDAIHAYQGTLCFLPNFSYEHLSRTVSTIGYRGDTLSSIRGFINCSEPVSAWTHKRFLERFAAIGARADQMGACYAMAENVFAVTQSRMGFPAENRTMGGRTFVSCGSVIEGTECKVVSGDDGATGEILIRGNSLFDGYFLKEDITQTAFTSDGWFKTGDLGFLADGELYVTGRKKDLIIVQGRNFYPSDIEAVVSEVSPVLPGRVVAFGVYDEELGTEFIVVLAETAPYPPQDPDQVMIEIRRCVAQALDCTVKDIRFVEPRWIIKSTSGKHAHSDNKNKYLYQFHQAHVPDGT